jgi:tRNA pseudouridine55 synthase
MFGFLNINKPEGVTSRHVTSQIQRLMGRGVKVGHAGTLDPIATGVLVMAIGPATRLISYLHRKPKSYIGSFRLGLKSDSQDISGDVEPVHNANSISASELNSILGRFLGNITQTPPKYSAIKIDGKRAYALARRGKEVIMPDREVEIYSLALRKFNYPDFEIEVKCSSGTYVRTLGSDIAVACGSDAVMTGLRRTQVGIFDITNSSELGQLTNRTVAAERIESPTVTLRDHSRRKIDDSGILNLFYGQNVRLDCKSDDAIVTDAGRLIAIVSRKENQDFKPHINFVHHWLKNGAYELDKLTGKQVS